MPCGIMPPGGIPPGGIITGIIPGIPGIIGRKPGGIIGCPPYCAVIGYIGRIFWCCMGGGPMGGG